MAGDTETGVTIIRLVEELDAGPVAAGSCNPECHRGFHCEAGRCVLNGADGPLQVTLKFGRSEDLDLHVVEPGGCEVFYGHTACVGSLDLDSNAGCSVDHVDLENVIYPDPDGGAPILTGTYLVRVDLYSLCDGAAQVPYELTVRKADQIYGFCGLFSPAIADSGGAGSGVLVTSFTYP